MNLEVTRSRELYRKHCDSEESVSLFHQDWWLDAVAKDAWDVLLATQGDVIVGALPFVVQHKWGFKVLTQPVLTPALGPWLRATDRSYSKALAYEKQVLGKLADCLPQCHYYMQNWTCEHQNWLPFFWRGFDQTTRYTYRISELRDEKKVWSDLQENIRREIRKARDRFHITVRPANDLDEFLAVNFKSFERQGLSQPYSRNIVARIEEAAASRAARDCLVAVDPDGNCHAGAYIVRKRDSAYYLMGGGDPALRNSGATSLVLWESICRQPSSVTCFDFEGSMIEPIERFFRAFGAVQTPYFRVSKANSKFIRAALCLRSVVKKVK